MRLLATVCLGLIAATVQGSEATPYAGQENRAIKALSEDEIANLLAGKGMGLAKAAELNGYPGPAHVLEMASELSLTPEQRQATETLYRSMQARAAVLGQEIIAKEKALDELFARKTISEQTLSKALDEIGALQGRLRATHLEAHLAEAKLLTPEQMARYAQHRGYR